MQTKLSVALAATLAGFALSAQAANVEVYGLIDTGLNYQHVDADRAGVVKQIFVQQGATVMEGDNPILIE